jgi:hypothetical protein
MDYPNRKRLVLVFAAVAACSVWLAVDMNTGNNAPAGNKPLDQVPRVTSLAAPSMPTPAHRSVAIEVRNRTAPVMGD